ncbi:MAG: PQQ-binding-like beta-propeller repeat protein [Gemmataceae bacterium]
MNRREHLVAVAGCVAAGTSAVALPVGAASHEKEWQKLPGKGRKVLGSDKGQVALVGEDGTVAWSFALRSEVHDVHQLAEDRFLLPVARDRVAEVDRKGKVLWSYQAEKVSENRQHIEIHAVQRLKDGTTMVAESGNRRLAIVDPDGKVAHTVPLTINNPNPHRDTRLVRQTPEDTFLVCHEGDGTVREYDRRGKAVWSHKLDLAGRPRSGGHGPEGHGTEVYGAWRTPKGSTWIACGNGNRVIEVDASGKVVWSLEQKEIPGVVLAWVTMLHLLPDGNVIVGNCHAGPDQPQLIEVNRDKKLVWAFHNFKQFGNGLAAAQVFNLPEGTIR